MGVLFSSGRCRSGFCAGVVYGVVMIVRAGVFLRVGVLWYRVSDTDFGFDAGVASDRQKTDARDAEGRFSRRQEDRSGREASRGVGRWKRELRGCPPPGSEIYNNIDRWGVFVDSSKSVFCF